MSVEESISAFVEDARFSDLSEDAIQEIKRHVVDSVGVALASVSSPPAKAAFSALQYNRGNAPVIGGKRSTPDYASFCNTLLIRYLDFNDTYLSLEPLHPSDMIGALLSLYPYSRGNVKELMLSIAVGYEVGVRLCDAFSLRSKGFDHVNYLEVAAAAALSKLLRFDSKQTQNAISMALVPNVALRQSRVGALSMWKAGAAADASRKAAFAALMTRSGFTAPSSPFTGKFGLVPLICGEGFSFNEKGMEEMRSILRTHLKKYPVEYHAQSAADMAIQLSAEMGRSGIRGVRRVLIETYEAGVSILADREKWSPANRETADHSLPFIVAASLCTGDMWLDTYSKLKDREIRRIMSVTEVVERVDYTENYPSHLPTRITVETDKGTYFREMDVPRGHALNPMGREELKGKFVRLTGKDRLFEKLMRLEGFRG
ncbi:MAG: MmgE/PrpD family protein, partial [Methanomassiliicoccales archaeon]